VSERKPTREEVLASIVPKSDQLNASDCVAGPMTITVERVTLSADPQKQPVNVHLVGHDRVFRPCKTCRRILIAIWGDEANDWIGKSMTLYTDPEVKWQGQPVGGLRISHVTDLAETKRLSLAESRIRSKDYVIHPLSMPTDAPPPLTEEEQEFVQATTAAIAEADAKTLKAFAVQLKDASQAVRDALRPVYAAREKELSE